MNRDVNKKGIFSMINSNTFVYDMRGTWMDPTSTVKQWRSGKQKKYHLGKTMNFTGYVHGFV